MSSYLLETDFFFAFLVVLVLVEREKEFQRLAAGDVTSLKIGT